ncbi:MAG TPA: hypothetical protein VK608_13245, partial [Edaphobacter sp.]|nr:hypothetical protein [Edaphobacter sp.]
MPDEILHPEAAPEQPDETTPHEASVSKPDAESQGPAASEPESVPAEDSAVLPERHEPFALQHPVAAPAPEPKRTSAKDREKEEASQSPFSVTVGQVYDGPLDLLLDLIRKQNIDIYDIPIARITAQFLDYTHQLKQTD